MPFKLRIKSIIAFVLFANFLIGQETSYIHCGFFLDVEKSSIQKEVTIIVENDLVKDVVQGYVNPKDNSTVINLKNKYVMPGFMDMHVHLEQESNPKRYEEGFRNNDADIALKATTFCEKTLMAGFTTVRDLGGTGINVSLRNAINNSYIKGPRIFTAEKSIATTGGHADPTNGVKDELRGDPGPAEGVINSPEEAAKAVRQRYKNGADVIKITATGGVLSVAKDGSSPQFTLEEIEAVVKTAKDYNMITAAHAHGAEGMKRAVLGGIHSIEHGTMMTEEVMDLMISKGTYYVPTISAGKFVADKAKIPGFYPAIIVPKALAIGPQIQQTFAKAYKRGVKIAFGTDSGVSIHGDNADEFVFMVEAGMNPWDALKSATVNAADLLNMSDTIGSISKGKKADIVAVSRNPIEEIAILKKVDFVMKDGKVFKQ
ncbi:MAG: amidohydrolase family protein [Saprospiraceae bacterium]|nr:amidohydrolase family protein [Saprospiraceae bacterium]